MPLADCSIRPQRLSPPSTEQAAHEGLKERRQGTCPSQAVLLALRNGTVKPQQPVPMQLAQHHLQTAIGCPSHQHPFPEGPSPYLEPSSYPQQAWGKSLVKTKNMPGPCGEHETEKRVDCQIYMGVIISSMQKKKKQIFI